MAIQEDSFIEKITRETFVSVSEQKMHFELDESKLNYFHYNKKLRVFELDFKSHLVQFPENFSIFEIIKRNIESENSVYFYFDIDSDTDNLFEVLYGPNRKNKIFLGVQDGRPFYSDYLKFDSKAIQKKLSQKDFRISFLAPLSEAKKAS